MGKTLFLAKGRIKAKAHGYWFTSGGEKAAFGFYPHLKDTEGYPVFPDTQLHGDLRMAARWFLKLNGDEKKEMIIKVFGDEPKAKTRNIPSRLFLTDLTLTNDSKRIWRQERFEIKPRIAIDDKKRTVSEHMLVNMEVAYMEGIELEAGFYLGYFNDEDEFNRAKWLIEGSISLLSGFGQSRSRGYGRAELEIEWAEDERIAYSAIDNSNENATYLVQPDYFLKALINMRNKPVQPGSTQFLPSRYAITEDQVRAWFVRTYHSLFDSWPEYEEMKSLSFSWIYPAWHERDRFFYGIPPAMTTLKNEVGKIRDIVGISQSPKEEEKIDQENFFSTKTKPLPKDYFVTTDNSPSVFRLETERRIRNQIEDNFATAEDGGLFVQELVRKGQYFGGKINLLRKADETFHQRAIFILQNIKPVIGGTIFEPILNIDNDVNINKKGETDNPSGEKPLHYLVVTPIPFDFSLVNYIKASYSKRKDDEVISMDANMISLDTIRRYNTTLRRPKRPEIFIWQGSVIKDEDGIENYKENIISWHGFGKDLELKKQESTKKIEEKVYIDEKKPSTQKRPEYFDSLAKNMTPSQAGILKEFLNRHRSIEDIKRVVEDREEKYKKKQKDEWQKLYEEIKYRCDKDPTGEEMRKFVRFLLEKLFEYWRKDKKVEGERG